MSTDEGNDAPNTAIRVSIPERYYMLPGAAILVGTTIGLFRGSRLAALRYLAENAHRPPTTVKGWYLYNKTKNYRMMLGGLRQAGLDAMRLGTTAAAWVIIEEGCERLGAKDVSEVAAGLGTAGIFAGVYRMPGRVMGQAMVLGALIGASLRGMRWVKTNLRHEADVRRAEAEVEAEEGREEISEKAELVRKAD
ncbi:hypothetical protein CERSUDRAFT_111397 [Gelatoporia subvermispora B]|uniref:Uncharacterized protein n=1 Tax=Ceriporiopsis subvermispora (strain B) TaxID=914234 RepID=M2RQS8_CERS8|nr:hypothetical protein CERSUDRAFT_111397 [Gelatoporia subvermispora B]